MRANDGTGQRGHTTPKHVWVALPGSSSAQAPGILLEWRPTGGGAWEAYVVWAERGADDASRAHLEWVDQDRVRPWE